MMVIAENGTFGPFRSVLEDDLYAPTIRLLCDDIVLPLTVIGTYTIEEDQEVLIPLETVDSKGTVESVEPAIPVDPAIAIQQKIDAITKVTDLFTDFPPNLLPAWVAQLLQTVEDLKGQL